MRKYIDEDFLNLKRREIRFVDSLEKSNFARTVIGGIDIGDINKISKLIIASNPEIKIEYICYVRKGKMLVFYGEKKLNITAYKKDKEKMVTKSGKASVNNYLYSALENCGEVKMNEVSLMDLSGIYHAKAQEFNEKIRKYKDFINLEISIKSDYSFCHFIDFNYKTNILTLGFDRREKYHFKINDENIEYLDGDFAYLEEYIWGLYHFYEENASYCKTDIMELSSTNTKFFVNFGMLGFTTYLKNSRNALFKIDFDALTNYFGYTISSTSDKGMKFIEDNYRDFLNYIYVSIDSLPAWLQKEVLINKKDMLDSKRKGFFNGALNLLQRIRDLF